MRRMLVAGFGNVLRGDDGFGVEVVRRLQEAGVAPEGTVCLEVGTGGVALAQELMTPCDRLVIVDDLTLELSGPVQQAIEPALRNVQELLAR
jgi:hydrogenase maturation protease